MAEYEVKAQVPAVSDYIRPVGICGVRPVAGLSRKTVAAAKSAYAENTCKKTRECSMADHATPAFYETCGFTKATLPNATEMYPRL